MISKLINDTKYFFERLFSKDGTPLLMLCIIAAVLAVTEVVFYLFLIRNTTSLNVPFLVIYTYFLYVLNRLLIRAIQYLLCRFNVLKYKVDNYNYQDDDMNSKIRRYNSSIYVKEKDRYDATIVYIITLIVFFLIILTFVLKAENIIKIIIAILLFVPFILLIKDPYEIITIDVNEKDLKDMTKKDYIETFLDRIFKERQITSPVDLPGEAVVEQQLTPQEQEYYDAMLEQQALQAQQQQVVDKPPQPEVGDINQQIENQEITGQWWQQ